MEKTKEKNCQNEDDKSISHSRVDGKNASRIYEKIAHNTLIVLIGSIISMTIHYALFSGFLPSQNVPFFPHTELFLSCVFGGFVVSQISSGSEKIKMVLATLSASVFLIPSYLSTAYLMSRLPGDALMFVDNIAVSSASAITFSLIGCYIGLKIAIGFRDDYDHQRT